METARSCTSVRMSNRPPGLSSPSSSRANSGWTTARLKWARFHQGSGNCRWMASSEPGAKMRGTTERASASSTRRLPSPCFTARSCVSRAYFLRHSKATKPHAGVAAAVLQGVAARAGADLQLQRAGEAELRVPIGGGFDALTKSRPTGSGRRRGRDMTEGGLFSWAGVLWPGQSDGFGAIPGLHEGLPRCRRGAASSAGCALALGNFDGVHVGHQALFAEARRHGGPPPRSPSSPTRARCSSRSWPPSSSPCCRASWSCFAAQRARRRAWCSPSRASTPGTRPRLRGLAPGCAGRAPPRGGP